MKQTEKVGKHGNYRGPLQTNVVLLATGHPGIPVDVGRVLGAGYSDGGVPDSLHWGPQLDPEGLLVVFLPTAHPDMCTRLLP